MNIPECISFINRRTLCCGLLLTLLSYGYAQQRTGEEVSGKPMMLYFHFDRVLVDSSYMDNSRTFRHMDQLFTILSIMPHTIETDTLTFLQSGKTCGNRSACRQALVGKWRICVPLVAVRQGQVLYAGVDGRSGRTLLAGKPQES